jgi:hypothetical protein
MGRNHAVLIGQVDNLSYRDAGKKQTMDTMIAYCGLACDNCPVHLATLEQDPVKRQTMTTGIAQICREKYGLNLQPQDVKDCDGCRSATGRLFSGCANCEIRKCALDRKVSSCAFCDDYACPQLLKHFETDPHARIRLEQIRKVS